MLGRILWIFMVLLYGVKSCEELQAESKAQELQAEIEELQAVINASKAPEQNATLMDTIDEEGFPSILNREQKPQRILVQFSLSTKPKWLARKEVFATVTQSLWNTMQNKWTRTVWSGRLRDRLIGIIVPFI